MRRFAKRVGDLQDARDPQMTAGIVTELRVINGQRGRVAIFKLDDKSDVIEAVANEELLDANRDLLKDDELLVIQGKVQPDRFSGGLRLNVQQIWSLAAARSRFARFVRLSVQGRQCPVDEVLRAYPARRIPAPQPDLPETLQGLPLRVVIERRTPDVSAKAELDLGDQTRVYPSDEALRFMAELMPEAQATVVYGEG